MQPEFQTPLVGLLTVMDMALGELSYIERALQENAGPFQNDNLILMTLFMILISISLINLLIGVAVGDIDAIKSDANIMVIALRVGTWYPFEFHQI